MKVTVESDSEGEENDEEVVVEVEQRPSSLSLQDRVATRQQFEHKQVSHIRPPVVPNWIFLSEHFRF